MNSNTNKKNMPVSWAVVLIVLVALAGGIAFYIQRNLNESLKASAEQSLVAQQNQTMAVLDQIEANLARIREHESMIQQDFSGPEHVGNLAPEERIQNEINFIEHLLEQNNALIASLNTKIDEQDTRLASYERNVKDLKTRITGYQEQLDLLVAEKEALRLDLDRTIVERNDLAVKVEHMDEDIQQKSRLIDDQQNQLVEKDNAYHTAYFTVGTFKTLRDKSVLQKEGGFLGINRVTTLAESPDNGQFDKIDTREVTRIPIFAKRFEIVSERDPSSYEVEFAGNRAEWLQINDPEKFWKNSRYLVIVVHDNEFDELAESR